MTHCGRKQSRASQQRCLSVLRDQRGLSTMEYAVLFIIIIIGSLALWSRLGRSLAGQVGTGTQTFETTLGAAQKRGSDEAAPNNGSPGASVGPESQSSAPAASPATQPSLPGTKKQRSY